MNDINLPQMRLELKRDEGIRFTAYKDSRGFWTIGVGHLLTGVDDPLFHRTLTLAEVDKLLDSDINKAVSDVISETWFKACDTDARKRAIVNMCFQLGHNGIREFVNSLKLITNKQWRAAADRMRLSAWYKETPKRAERVLTMLETG